MLSLRVNHLRLIVHLRGQLHDEVVGLVGVLGQLFVLLGEHLELVFHYVRFLELFGQLLQLVLHGVDVLLLVLDLVVERLRAALFLGKLLVEQIVLLLLNLQVNLPVLQTVLKLLLADVYQLILLFHTPRELALVALVRACVFSELIIHIEILL